MQKWTIFEPGFALHLFWFIYMYALLKEIMHDCNCFANLYFPNLFCDFEGKSGAVHLWLRTERFSLSISPRASVYWQLRWEAGRGNGLICFLWLGNGKSPLRGSQLTDSNPSAQTSMRILLASSSTPPPNVVSPMRPKSCKGITEKNQSLAVRPSSVLGWIV